MSVIFAHYIAHMGTDTAPHHPAQSLLHIQLSRSPPTITLPCLEMNLCGLIKFRRSSGDCEEMEAGITSIGEEARAGAWGSTTGADQTREQHHAHGDYPPWGHRIWRSCGCINMGAAAETCAKEVHVGGIASALQLTDCGQGWGTEPEMVGDGINLSTTGAERGGVWTAAGGGVTGHWLFDYSFIQPGFEPPSALNTIYFV
ncbi:hypothetical protein C8R44DRAFT_734697 [Mycena epipterygia]|nr:hypothetical protein C8R44DRAFT_734697 [Mycena epipterygia]